MAGVPCCLSYIQAIGDCEPGREQFQGILMPREESGGCRVMKVGVLVRQRRKFV